MYTSGIGLVLALLVTTTSQDSSQTKGIGGALSGFASAALGTVNKIVFDKVDINSIFNGAIGDVTRRLGTSSCIAGVYVNDEKNELTLKLIDGKMANLHKMVVRPKTVKEDANTITVNISFSFPSLPINYKFYYSSVRLFTKVDRDGNVDLNQEGPVSVSVLVNLPKSQKKVDELLAASKCVVNVEDVKLSQIEEKELHSLKVDYPSYAKAFGLQMTEGSVVNLLKGLREDLQDNIKAALRQLIEPTFRENALNCKDATYSAPATERAIDCRHFINANKYKPHQ